jgi:hypothetical protein
LNAFFEILLDIIIVIAYWCLIGVVIVSNLIIEWVIQVPEKTKIKQIAIAIAILLLLVLL